MSRCPINIDIISTLYAHWELLHMQAMNAQISLYISTAADNVLNFSNKIFPSFLVSLQKCNIVGTN